MELTKINTTNYYIIVDLLNASDAFKVVRNDLFSEYGFNQVQKSSVFGAFFRLNKTIASLARRSF